MTRDTRPHGAVEEPWGPSAVAKKIIAGAILAVILAAVFLPVWNVNGKIDKILGGTSSIRIELGSYEFFARTNQRLGKYKTTITDPALIRELKEASRTKGESILLGGHCMCDGYPIVVADNGAYISYHHGQSLRVSGNSTNYSFRDPDKFAAWLRKVGLPSDDEMQKLVEEK